jgi:hypothetical protein
MVALDPTIHAFSIPVMAAQAAIHVFLGFCESGYILNKSTYNMQCRAA